MPISLSPDEIRAMRKSLGLSQVTLAEALGASRRTVEDWEAGKNPAPPMLSLALRCMQYDAGMEHEAADGDRPLVDITEERKVTLKNQIDDAMRLPKSAPGSRLKKGK